MTSLHVALFMTYSRNPYFTDAKLRQGRSQKISCRIADHLHRQSVGIDVFVDERQSLKARTHLNVR